MTNAVGLQQLWHQGLPGRGGVRDKGTAHRAASRPHRCAGRGRRCRCGWPARAPPSAACASSGPALHMQVARYSEMSVLSDAWHARAQTLFVAEHRWYLGCPFCAPDSHWNGSLGQRRTLVEPGPAQNVGQHGRIDHKRKQHKASRPQHHLRFDDLRGYQHAGCKLGQAQGRCWCLLECTNIFSESTAVCRLDLCDPHHT